MHKPANGGGGGHDRLRKGVIMSHGGSPILRTVSEIVSSDENREAREDTMGTRVGGPANYYQPYPGTPENLHFHCPPLEFGKSNVHQLETAFVPFLTPSTFDLV